MTLDRLFLDANILFSAAYRESSGLGKLWKLRGVTLVSSAYAVGEARHNLDDPARLDVLTRGVQVVMEPGEAPAMPDGVTLPEKDTPILTAAIRAEATHLLTGDLRHFGPYMDKKIEGVLIQTPARYLQQRKGR
jgi:hypothetical protein